MERKEVIVSEQELARQKEFTRKMREMNDRRTRTPLALVDTFGCQQNVADGEVLMGMLREMGYELTRDENQADVILLNTCAIREHAEKRVYGHLGRLSHTKAAKPDQIICLCGCMAQQKVVADKVKNSYHHVDLVLGPQAEWRLPELLAGGYTADTPAAVVYKATWPEEHIFRCTVGTLHETVTGNGLTKTSLIVVGNCLGDTYLRSLLYHPNFTTEFRKGAQ